MRVLPHRGCTGTSDGIVAAMATDVVLLGTGTPRTELGRAGAATAVTVDGVAYIFDFGPGVGRRIARGHQTGIRGMAFTTITKAFRTHHHSDHTTGLPDLYLTSWMFGRDQPLDVYGPLGTSAMCEAIMEAYSLDVAKRTLNEPHAPEGHRMIDHDVAPGLAYEDERVRVRAFDVPHGEWAPVHGPHPTLGYRVTTGDRIVVISGDTAWHEGMADAYAGADVLVHEVLSSRGLASRTAEWQAYHRTAHTSATDLGQVASVITPRTVVLTHQLLWGAEPDDIVEEITDVYAGNVIYGTDLLVV